LVPTIKNTIFYSTSGTKAIIDSGAGLTYTDANIDYNSYNLPLQGITNSGGSHSKLLTNPLFTNGSGSYSLATDFTLSSGSPAKWAGVNVGLTTDYAGKPVHNPPSMGSFEFIPLLGGSKFYNFWNFYSLFNF
jgi:hypothetical protein